MDDRELARESLGTPPNLQLNLAEGAWYGRTPAHMIRSFDATRGGYVSAACTAAGLDNPQNT